MAGRKPYLETDPKLIDRLCERLQMVFYLKHAVDAIGISERVVYKWIDRGEREVLRMERDNLEKPAKKEAVYVQLVQSLKKTKADNVTRHSTNWQRHGLGQAAQYLKDPETGELIRDKQTGNPIQTQAEIIPDWKASESYLGAVDHERWGRKLRTEITTPLDAGPSELRITIVKKRDVPPRKKDKIEE